MDSPRVSVVLPAHNAEAYLDGAIESVRSQTFKDWELLVISDRSEGRTVEIVERLRRSESRLRFLENRFPDGIAGALNTGILAARGDYLARMDADELCTPEHLSRLVEFLDSHPRVGAVGTNFEVFNSSGTKPQARHSRNPLLNALCLCADSSVGHPAAMLRRKAALMAGGYFAHEPAANLGLWARVSLKWEVADLEFVGLRCRERGADLSRTSDDIEQSVKKIGLIRYETVMRYQDGYAAVRNLIKNPERTNWIRRLPGALLSVIFCLRMAKIYGIPKNSPRMREALLEILRLSMGRNFRG